MADLIDEANETAELFLSNSLRKSQQSARIAPHAIGTCLSCGEFVATDLRWCDADCRDDWQAAQDRAKRR